MKSCIALAGLLLTGFVSHAQTYTLDDVIPGGRTYRNHIPKGLIAPVATDIGVLHFKKDSLMLCSITENGVVNHLYMTSAEWQKLSGSIGNQVLPYFQIDRPSRSLYTSISTYEGREIVVFDMTKKAITKRIPFPDVKGMDVRDDAVSFTKGLVALTDGHNLFLSTEGQGLTQITKDGTNDIVYGMPAARNEFGTDHGMFWSPTGRYLAFYRIDQTAVASYPIVHIGRPIAKVDPIKYPMAGQASQQVTIGIYDTENKTIHYLKSGLPKEKYLTNVAWSPDERMIYVEEVPRDQKSSTLIGYNVETGEPSAPLLTERDDRYVEPLLPILFVPRHKELFIHYSRHDGYRHLFLYQLKNGKASLVRQLTPGVYEVESVQGIDPQGEWLYYTSNEEYPIGKALYRVSLSNGHRERLSPDLKGSSIDALSPNCVYAYDRFSSNTIPLLGHIIKLGQTPLSKEVVRAANPDKRYDMPEIELGHLKADDGITDLYYKMTLPPHLDKSKKYPVIVYVYGGPHAQLVVDSWRRLHQTWDCYMAQKGYIVFTLDNRGSNNRGMAFESIIHNRLGQVEMADQMTGIKYLKSLPFVDRDRIGVHGWSFGGFMTTNLILSHPEVFKVAVAGGPVMDWRLYEVMYGERYMSTPQSNPKGYDEANLISRAGDLKGRLMLIHGTVDPVVVWQNSLEFLNAAIKHRKMPDYMVYPEVEHNVIGPDRVQLYMVISRYFDDHLK